jgi:hypothetical protein
MSDSRAFCNPAARFDHHGCPAYVLLKTPEGTQEISGWTRRRTTGRGGSATSARPVLSGRRESNPSPTELQRVTIMTNFRTIPVKNRPISATRKRLEPVRRSITRHFRPLPKHNRTFGACNIRATGATLNCRMISLNWPGSGQPYRKQRRRRSWRRPKLRSAVRSSRVSAGSRPACEHSTGGAESNANPSRVKSDMIDTADLFQRRAR